jgi:hypothetical protein
LGGCNQRRCPDFVVHRVVFLMVNLWWIRGETVVIGVVGFAASGWGW